MIFPKISTLNQRLSSLDKALKNLGYSPTGVRFYHDKETNKSKITEYLNGIVKTPGLLYLPMGNVKNRNPESLAIMLHDMIFHLPFLLYMPKEMIIYTQHITTFSRLFLKLLKEKKFETNLIHLLDYDLSVSGLVENIDNGLSDIYLKQLTPKEFISKIKEEQQSRFPKRLGYRWETYLDGIIVKYSGMLKQHINENKDAAEAFDLLHNLAKEYKETYGFNPMFPFEGSPSTLISQRQKEIQEALQE